MPIRRHNKEHLLAADLPQEGFREASNDAKHGISHLSPALVAAVRASLVKKYQEAQVSVARCVNEPRWSCSSREAPRRPSSAPPIPGQLI